MEWLILAVCVAGIVGACLLMVYAVQARQISTLQKSNSELAQTLGDIARVEHGVPPAKPVEPMTLEDLEKLDIFGSQPHIAFPRAELADDPTLQEDPNRLGEWDVPPGLLDAAGDEDMT